MIPNLREPQYAPLKTEDTASPFDDDSRIDTLPAGVSAGKHSTSRFTCIVYRLAFIASLITNLALAIALYNAKTFQQVSQQMAQQLSQQTPQQICQQPISEQPKLEKSRYAELEYNVNGTWETETPYAQENITAADEVWMALDISNAFVALTQDHATQLELPRSLPFPWDRQKELYLISSIHSMHCLTVFHRSNLEYRMNHTQTYATEHILHCLDNIRVDLECNADDTPRFVPAQATESTVKTGVGQIRKCRSWSKLNDWTKQHDACFKYNEFLRQELQGNKVYPSAWQFCEKGSEYLPIVQKFLGKGSDWVAPSPAWPDVDKIQGH